MTVFDTLMNDGLTVLNESHGATVTLSQGAVQTASMTARRKQRRSGLISTNITGVSQRATFREYWLPQSGCVFAGESLRPQPGGRITDGSEVWEIDAFSDGERAVESVRGLEWKCQTRLVIDG